MSGPATVEGARFFDFIGGAPVCVVLLSAHPWHTFSNALAQQLAVDHAGIALGTVDLGGLLFTNAPALRFIHQGLRACGAPSAFGVLPGYCLFRERELLAWDAGMPAIGDLAALTRSGIIGAACSAVAHDTSFLNQAFKLAVDHVSAGRVAAHFRTAASAPRARRASHQDTHGGRDRAAADPRPTDELFWAYQVLGVLPTASDDEVHQAWRRRRAEHHPDSAAGDASEFERRSRISTDINRARDIITAYRTGRVGYAHAS